MMVITWQVERQAIYKSLKHKLNPSRTRMKLKEDGDTNFAINMLTESWELSDTVNALKRKLIVRGRVSNQHDDYQSKHRPNTAHYPSH